MNRRPRRSREWLRQGIAVGMTPAFWAATPVEAQALPSDVVSSFKNAFGSRVEAAVVLSGDCGLYCACAWSSLSELTQCHEMVGGWAQPHRVGSGKPSGGQPR